VKACQRLGDNGPLAPIKHQEPTNKLANAQV